MKLPLHHRIEHIFQTLVHILKGADVNNRRIAAMAHEGKQRGTGDQLQRVVNACAMDEKGSEKKMALRSEVK